MRSTGNSFRNQIPSLCIQSGQINSKGRDTYRDMHPDLEELQQRDVFLAKLERECPVRIEGADLVTTIPDIDAATLAGVKSKN